MIVDGLLSDEDNSSLDESHLSSGSHSDYAYSDSSETGKNFNNDTSADKSTIMINQPFISTSKDILSIDHLNNTMSKIYCSNENLSRYESIILWRDRLIFTQYIKNKRSKCGLKLHEFCRSTSIILQTSIYSDVSFADFRASRCNCNESANRLYW